MSFYSYIHYGEAGATAAPATWVASSKRDYGQFPARVQDQFGFALFLAQGGLHPPSAKLLKGFGSGVVELVEDFDGDTYRAVYTIRLSKALYVLHAFKKKSRHGRKTPLSDIDLIRRRLSAAERNDAERDELETKR
jgi:phage-related protein